MTTSHLQRAIRTAQKFTRELGLFESCVSSDSGMSRRIQEVWTKKILVPGETDFAAELRTFLFLLLSLESRTTLLAWVGGTWQANFSRYQVWPDLEKNRLWYGSVKNGFGF